MGNMRMERWLGVTSILGTFVTGATACGSRAIAPTTATQQRLLNNVPAIPAVVVNPSADKKEEYKGETPKLADEAEDCQRETGGNKATDARYEPWSKQFAVYELLPSGERIALDDSAQQFVDVSSAIVIERISDSPTKITATNGTEDARAERDPTRFDIDVVILRANGCRAREAVPSLQDIGGYDDPMRQPGCPDVYPAFTRPRTIKEGDKFIIPGLRFQPGDSVQLQLTGRLIGYENSPKKVESTDATIEIAGKQQKGLPKLVNDPGGKEAKIDLYTLEKRPICGEDAAVAFRVVDFAAMIPVEDRRGVDVPLLSRNARSDNRNDVYFKMNGAPAGVADELFRNAVSVSATAVGTDGKSRDIGLAKNAARPTLDHLDDGETVVIKINRRVKSDGGKELQKEIKSYSFTAVAAGLQSRLDGERKASVGTTSAFFTLLTKGGRYGFAQTFSYTISNKALYPSFWDEVGAGIHVSVLARPKDDDSMSDEPLAVGVGAHFALGANAVHVGAGYDVINGKGYALIGLSLEDFANLISGSK